jgi:uncharacterized protein YkwD
VISQTIDELFVINEINQIRTNPKSYIPKVEDYIKTQESFLDNFDRLNVNVKSVNGGLDVNNNTVNTKTLVGKDVFIRNIKAAKDLINVLDTLSPTQPLRFDSDMYEVTKKHGDYLKTTNKHGHYGHDGETISDRLSGFGSNGSENCGSNLLGLMVDAGISGYGHRYNILNPKWSHISIYIVPNYNGFMVQNFHN